MNMAKVGRLLALLIVIALAAYLGILPQDGKDQPSDTAAARKAEQSITDPGEQRIDTSAEKAAIKPVQAENPQPVSRSEPLQKGWSRSKPNINLTHVFFGEINRRGKPTGYHSRPGGKDPEGAKVKRISSGPNKAGVYTANVEIWDRQERQWKGKFSTFFPDSMGQQQVMAAILNAYKKRNKGKSAPWEGPSGHGFRIQGYESSRGGINTAYPVYRRD